MKDERKQELLKKFGDKVKFKKEENLLGPEDFENIELIHEISAERARKINKNCYITIRDKDGNLTTQYDESLWQMSVIEECILFDGKKLSVDKIGRLKSDFLQDLFSLLTLPESDSGKTEKTEV